MAKFTVKTESAAGLPIESTRKCESVRDVQKLMQQHAKALAQSFRVFPSFADAKVGRVSVAKE